MDTSTQPAVRHRNVMEQLNWSHAEKTIARRAFEAALAKELEQTLQDAKTRVSNIKDVSELWDMEDWLRHRRRGIDEKYDYRYSVLPEVLARLICEGRISQSDLSGLHPDKMDVIQRFVDLQKQYSKKASGEQDSDQVGTGS